MPTATTMGMIEAPGYHAMIDAMRYVKGVRESTKDDQGFVFRIYTKGKIQVAMMACGKHGQGNSYFVSETLMK